MKTKICTKCHIKKLKSKENFYFRKDSNKYRNECKICFDKQTKKYHKKYYKLNKENVLKRNKIWAINNKNKIEQSLKLWRIKNIIKIRKYHKLYSRNKRLTKVRFRITDNMRRRINYAIKTNTKSLSTMFLIGCEIDYLMYYLESQFKKGMSWDNYGIWEIDHIRPCASFDMFKPIDQKRCFNYRNLQPLWKEENRRKGNKCISKN